jgi:hypothetical protein
MNSSSLSAIAALMAGDFQRENADLGKLIEEASVLLTAVDLSISQAELPGDEDLRRLKTSWAFIGPGTHRVLKALRLVARNASMTRDRSIEYDQLANVITWLNIRRQTLELNAIAI